MSRVFYRIKGRQPGPKKVSVIATNDRGDWTSGTGRKTSALENVNIEQEQGLLKFEMYCMNQRSENYSFTCRVTYKLLPSEGRIPGPG